MLTVLCFHSFIYSLSLLSKSVFPLWSEQEVILQNDYTVASQKYESNPCDSNANQLTAAKEKLELFYEQKTKGIIIRAQARWHEHGERSNKYFLNLEKRNYVKKHMRKLNINESITTDPFIILSEPGAHLSRFVHIK